MDAALFIVVKKGTVIPAREVRRKTQAWQGITYEDEPVVYVYGNSQLSPCPISGWVINMLPLEIRNADLDSYLVDDPAVTLLESEVNDIELEEPSTLPEWLRAIMNRSDVWLLAFLWHWDQLDEIQCGTVESAIEKLRAVLHWNGNRHGFCVYGLTQKSAAENRNLRT